MTRLPTGESVVRMIRICGGRKQRFDIRLQTSDHRFPDLASQGQEVVFFGKGQTAKAGRGTRR